MPRLYDLRLNPCLETLTFTGSLDIVMERATTRPACRWVDGVTNPLHKAIGAKVYSIELNSVGLDISHTSVKFQIGGSGQWIPCQHIVAEPKHERLTFHFSTNLTPGSVTTGTLRIEAFSGRIGDDLRGFYCSRYTLEGGPRIEGNPHVMASTHFEACAARRAFPCFDEPALRAQLALTIVTSSKHMTVLSCMPGTKRQLASGMCEWTFQPTPPCATYLMAWLVADRLDVVPAEGGMERSRSGVPVRVYTLPLQTDLGRFAQDVARQCLDFYEEYFGVPYTLPKLDLVCIPDFAMGAMENWGLITFRSTSLLCKEGYPYRVHAPFFCASE